MSMQQAMRQMPREPGRKLKGQGEAMPENFSDEASCPRHEPASAGSALLAAALIIENLRLAFKRVRSNKGPAGVDGLDIDQTSQLLVTEWPNIRARLFAGTYRPSPVRRVTIPKPDGGERELGIPTVTDRLIQQALLQIPQPLLDPTSVSTATAFALAGGRNRRFLPRKCTSSQDCELKWMSTWLGCSTG